MDKLDLFNLRRNVARRLTGNGLTTAGRFFEQPSTSSADIADAQNAYARQGLQAGALAEANRGMSNVEAARLRALKALGASQQPTASVTKPKLITADNTASGLRSMLPGRGTPGSAALGAFGQTMSQLGGWQDKPMTFGQILGASLGKAREAYGTAEERQRQIAADKAAALAAAEEKEYQRQQDAKKFRLEESKVKATARSDADKHYADAERMGLTGTMADEYVRSQLMKTKSTKPSGFVSVYTKDGDFVENVREDSPEADDYANKGYRIVESTSITGTKKDVGLGAKATGQIQTDMMDIQESISDLNDIQNSFDPKMQTFFTRGEAALKALLEKGGKELNEADAKLVGDVAVYKQNAWDAVNAYIKYLTGAQMSEAEARRIMKSFPDPRLGLSEGDSPTEYKRKLDGVLRKARLSLARNSYALSKGLTPSANPEADVEKNQDDVIYVDEKGRRLGIEQIPHLMRREESRLKKQFADLEESERESRVESEMRKIFSI